jgi:hypothetical protein
LASLFLSKTANNISFSTSFFLMISNHATASQQVSIDTKKNKVTLEETFRKVTEVGAGRMI